MNYKIISYNSYNIYQNNSYNSYNIYIKIILTILTIYIKIIHASCGTLANYNNIDIDWLID